jgi:TRAP transporter TAXI family solute receptor
MVSSSRQKKKFNAFLLAVSGLISGIKVKKEGNKMKKVVYGLLVITLFVSLMLGGFCLTKAFSAEPTEEWPKNIVIGSYGVGSAAYFVASALGLMIDKYTPMKTVQSSYSGGFHALTLMKGGRIDILINNTQETAPAYYAEGSFIGTEPYEISTMMVTFSIVQPPLTTKKTDVYKMEDLAGKIVLVGGPKTNPNIHEYQERPMLKYYGLLDKVTMVPYTSPGQIENDMVGGRAAGLIGWSLESPTVLSIAKSVGIRLLPLSVEAIAYCQKLGATMMPILLTGDRLEPFGYPADAKIPSYYMPMAVTVRKNLPDHVVYAIVKAFYDHFDEVKGIHRYVAETTLQRAVMDSGNPFHPGAVKYYKEKGAWGAEQEQRQAKQLSKPRGK